MAVSAIEKGKTKLRAIPHKFLIEIKTKVRWYQELRRVIVRLIEVHKKMLQVIDEMEEMGREEIPSPDKNDHHVRYRKGSKEFNNETLPNIRKQLLPSNNHIIAYFENCYVFCPV